MPDQEIIIKFKTDLPDFKQVTTEKLNKIIGSDVFKQAEQLFPNDSDYELASIYITKITGNHTVSDILNTLNRHVAIDYAHVPAERGGM